MTIQDVTKIALEPTNYIEANETSRYQGDRGVRVIFASEDESSNGGYQSFLRNEAISPYKKIIAI